MRHTACLGVAVAAALAALCAAPPTVAMDYMVVEHTSQRVLGPAVMHATPCGMHVESPMAYGHQAYAAAPAAATCSCGGSKAHGTCSCGGSKALGTCTCGKSSAPACSCGGSKADGTCTCGKKKPAPCGRNTQADMKDLAEEGIHTFFKVMRGGMKVVEHLADHINKKTAQLKPCGCKKACGCGLPPPCGCGVVGCGCGCRR